MNNILKGAFNDTTKTIPLDGLVPKEINISASPYYNPEISRILEPKPDMKVPEGLDLTNLPAENPNISPEMRKIIEEAINSRESDGQERPSLPETINIGGRDIGFNPKERPEKPSRDISDLFPDNSASDDVEFSLL